MSDYRGEHQAAVAAAKQKVTEVVGILHNLDGELGEAVGLIVNAVGDSPDIESAANALGMVAEMKGRADDLMGLATGALAELDRYGSGF